MKTALVLGIGGQDGSYIAEVLLEKGYKVHGLYRKSSVGNLPRIDLIKDKVTLHRGDLLDTNSVMRIISRIGPVDEIYNEADQDNVGWSHEIPGYTNDSTGAAVGSLLESLSIHCPEVKFFQPLSATMFGSSPAPQSEDSRLDPQSPYACSKAFAWHLCRYYRDTRGMFVSTAIFYNHDSPRRGKGYLLQEICQQAIEVAHGEEKKILLGNLDLLVDIGYALEYMDAAHSIMQQEKPDDFVIATGTAYSILSMARFALEYLGISPDGKIDINPKFYRKEKQSALVGTITKAQKAFGFDPKYHGKELIQLLIEVNYNRGG